MQSRQMVGPKTLPRVTWNVALSNGQEFHEYIKPFESIKGELTPWGRLLEYVEKNDLKITALWLTTLNGTRFNLPSAGVRTPRFRPFQEAGTPTNLRCFRSYAEETTGATEWCTVAEAEYYPTHKVQIWVSEHDPNNSWVLTILTGDGHG